MIAVEVLNWASGEGIQLYAQGERIGYRAPQGALTDELKSAIVQHRSELLTLLRRPNGAYCCSACERFAFPTPTTCFWCRKKGRADA